MPNHITNVVTIEAKNEVVKQIFNTIKGEETDIDFEKIIPMPAHIYRGNLGEAEEKKYGKENCWYEWSCKNWGTKWNAYESYIEKNILSFDTAWAMPEPIFKALSKMFKDVIFKVKWADEDIGHNCGEAHYKNGQLIFVYEPEGGSKEAYELAFEIKGGEEDYTFNKEENTYVYNEE